MAVSTVVKHFTDVSVSLEDGTGTAVTLTVPRVMVGLSISGIKQGQQAVHAYQTRGTLHSLRLGELEFATVSFQCMQADLTDASTGEIKDFILKTNAYSGNLSTRSGGANAEVYTVKMVITIEGTDHGDSADHTVSLDDVHFTLDITDGAPNVDSFSGTVYGAISFT